MKVVFIGSNQKTKDMASMSIRLRWPDTELLVASTVAEGLELVEKTSPDAVLLHPDFTDMSLSGAIEGLHRLSSVPLLVLGYAKDQMEVINSMESGADDYIRISFYTPAMLTARITALLRRAGPQSSSESEKPLASGKLSINPATYTASFNGEPFELTSTEFRLLHLLARNRGMVVQRQTLEQAIWGLQATTANSQGLVKKYVQRLRHKLGDDARMPRWIASVHGVGYRFVGPASTNSKTAIAG